MIVTADTSVVIPALALWHESHQIARKACRAVKRLPAHAMLASVSVLTRLPGGLALAGAPAVRVVREKFPGIPPMLSADEFTEFTVAIAAHDLRGGQVYETLVAATAASRGARLLTLDRHAADTYRAVGVKVELLAKAP